MLGAWDRILYDLYEVGYDLYDLYEVGYDLYDLYDTALTHARTSLARWGLHEKQASCPNIS